MSNWKKFNDELPPNLEPIFVANYDSVGIAATYNPSSQQLRSLHDGRELVEPFDVWMVFKPAIAPTATVLENRRFDAVAKTGEPSFTLLGRDIVAPALIEAWAFMRGGQILAAQNVLQDVICIAQSYEPQSAGDPQILSAFRKSGEMRAYARKQAVRA